MTIIELTTWRRWVSIIIWQMINRSKKYRYESAGGQIAHEIGSFFRRDRGTVTMPNCRFACVELFVCVELQQDVQLFPMAALYQDND
ncbi:hypothetical protein Ppb6_01640 [Photorhabdus australis subsp. thailandensis]|uniref:Uncharacterized protein n=1 Tax=Photorhabdus australis subsp. thailandensis TaxID=2805096 RepID=A0A1C0U5N2_9GAMM|nr:hypothetical protein [Photorhabdus australis]OCQ53239.1 hypothetical protein Ppb6_01640 [Photorhabdus australis subsp. thailandensis]